MDQAVVRLMDDMLETMYAAPGIGLAAPQVGESCRILVMDVSRDSESPQPLRMVNPVITTASADTRLCQEGCLSFPDEFADVERPVRVQVRYLDETGAERLLDADDLLAVCVQHEIDHLDGITFVDRLSAVRRGIILRRMRKRQRIGG